MAKNTPGPWKAKFNGYYWDIRAENFGDVGNSCASSAGGSDCDRSLELGEANALLMAAAPDMLAALKAAEQLLRDVALADSGDPEQDAFERETHAAVLASIAKAEGR